MEKRKERTSSEPPLISVIVPVYNVEPYIRQCLDSILNQTYQNLEIILVDDGSPDACGAICDAYAGKDGRVQVLHKENGGVADARNAGLAASHGDYIGWVDPDDWIEADMFAYLLGKAQQYASDITVCGRVEEYAQRTKSRVWEKEQLLDKEQALQQLLINKQMGSYLWDKLWRRELFDGIEFPKGRTFEDISVMHRLFVKAGRILCLPEIKYHYRQWSESIVGAQKLTARINRFIADKERYDDLLADWPQFTQLLEAQCMEAAVNVWNSYYDSTKQQRKMFAAILQDITEFSREHYKSALCCMDLGITGKLALPLTQYANPFSFRAASILYFIYRFFRAEK